MARPPSGASMLARSEPTLTVTVTAASNGSLSTAASYANSNTEDTTGKTFTNNYTKPSGAATLSVTKKVTGDTSRMSDEEKAQTYSFTLARDDANEKKTETLPSPLTATTSGDATGTILQAIPLHGQPLRIRNKRRCTHPK